MTGTVILVNRQRLLGEQGKQRRAGGQRHRGHGVEGSTSRHAVADALVSEGVFGIGAEALEFAYFISVSHSINDVVVMAATNLPR